MANHPHRVNTSDEGLVEEYDLNGIADRYLRFAQIEAAGESPLYVEYAVAVAECRAALAFLQDLPYDKQQPNLLFAAVRHTFGVPPSGAAFLSCLFGNTPSVRDLMLEKRVQTNEPARCATLLPVLARMDQPLSLLELGASAGLCLLPDMYSYRFVGRDGEERLCGSASPEAPTFVCSVGSSNAEDLPVAVPTIAWRMGLDINPLDLNDSEEMAWLKSLVWPEKTERRDNLTRAIIMGKRSPPIVEKYDVLEDLRHGLERVAQLVDLMPPDSTRVVFHSAFVSYLTSRDTREDFRKYMQQIPALWICNESPFVFADWPELEKSIDPKRFLLRVNGKPVALTGPHGQSFDGLTAVDK